MKSTSNKTPKLVLIVITLSNLILLYAGVSSGDLVILVFCGLIVQLLAVAIYLLIVNHNRNEVLKTNLTSLKHQLNDTYYRMDALMSIHHILTFRQPLPIMRSWTITADYAHALMQLILTRNSGDVLDVGSGISTIIAGYALEKRGNGKVISIEHNEPYYKHTEALVKLHGLEHNVEIHYCPLVKYEINDESWLWYDISKIKNSLTNVQVLSVDGPPGTLQNLSRYPALPLLNTSLPKDKVILLDDGARDDEQQIVERWKKEFGLTVDYTNSVKGLFILR